MTSPQVFAHVALATALHLVVAGPAAAQPQTNDQQKCLVALGKAATKLVKAHGQQVAACLKASAKGSLGECRNAEQCLADDEAGKLAKAREKVRLVPGSGCAEDPDFGVTDPTTIELVARFERLGLVADLFGSDLTPVAATPTVGADRASCQAALAKTSDKLAAAVLAAFQGCMADGLDDDTIDSAAALQACFDVVAADADGKLAKAEAKIASAVDTKCDEVSVADAAPGACAAAADPGACIAERVSCRVCRALNGIHVIQRDCDLFDDGEADASCQGSDGRCNGSAALCERAFDAVVHPTTHNAFSNDEENWSAPNQGRGLSRQLADGVTAMMLDTYDYAGDLYLCHGFCNLGEAQGKTPRELLVSGLGKIKRHLDLVPTAVVSIIFESYISEAQVTAAFTAAGLDGYVHSQSLGSPWPTLAEIVASGRRLVVFTDDSSATLPWHHYVWDYAWETHYSAETAADFSCDPNRGNPANSLFIFNHFLTRFTGSASLANQVNHNPFFVERAEECQSASGKLPNFVTVDFYDIGDLFEVTDSLNGLLVCPLGSR